MGNLLYSDDMNNSSLAAEWTDVYSSGWAEGASYSYANDDPAQLRLSSSEFQDTEGEMEVETYYDEGALGGGKPGLLFNEAASTNYWRVLINYSQQRLELKRGGSNEDTYATTLNYRQWYKIKVRWSNVTENVKVWLDDSLVIDLDHAYGSSEFESKLVNLYCNGNEDFFFKNFRIWDLVESNKSCLIFY